MEDINNSQQPEVKVTTDHLGTDWFGKHNFFSRLMVTAVVIVFVYAFSIPLATEYVDIISWVFVLVFMTMLFGINSLKLIIDLVQKIKGK